MNPVSLQTRRMAACALMCLIASCSMPPRDAWRIVQKQGLIPYLKGDYSTMANNPSMPTFSGPLQHNRYIEGLSRLEETEPHYDIPPPAPSSERIVSEATPAKPSPERTPPKVRPEPNLTHEKQTPSIAPKIPLESLPFGISVAGRPGMVMSPFASKDQLVDVTGMAPGDPVKCPYTGKLFRVPPTQQAASGSQASGSSVSGSPAKPTEPQPEPPPAPSTPVPPPPPSTEPAPPKP